METFIEKLDRRVRNANTLLCIGLDPHIAQLSEPTADAAANFCINIINQTKDYAAAYKPNSAFFEAFGPAGFEALLRTVKLIPKDIPVILDCKRGDIDTTAQAYATASFDVFDADAVTLSPYMGWDSIKPFIEDKFVGKGIFVLCKTSNSSSKDFQTLRLSSGEFVYEKVMQVCDQWNAKSPNGKPSVGVVVGATDIDALKRVRAISPGVWILCPGVGAQGGEPETVCPVGLRDDGSGFLVSVSRSISKAPDMALASRQLRDAINVLRERVVASAAASAASNISGDRKEELAAYQEEFIDFAINKRVLQFGDFKLKSGRQSPYFFNAGLFCCGQSLSSLGKYYAHAIHRSGLQFDVIFGPAYKGIPLATAVGIAWFELFGDAKDICYNRKEVKDHGEGGQLVGASMAGRRVLVVDDVITAGTAIREAVDILTAARAQLVGVVVALDRQEKASTAEGSDGSSAIQQVEKEFSVPVLAIVRLKHLLLHLYKQQRQRQPGSQLGEKDVSRMKEYRDLYGVDY